MRKAHLIVNIVSIFLYIIYWVLLAFTGGSIGQSYGIAGFTPSFFYTLVLGLILIFEFIFILKYGCYRYYNYINLLIIIISLIDLFILFNGRNSNLYCLALIALFNIIVSIISISYYNNIIKKSERLGETK